jgi:hypothetical protein
VPALKVAFLGSFIFPAFLATLAAFARELIQDIQFKNLDSKINSRFFKRIDPSTG